MESKLEKIFSDLISSEVVSWWISYMGALCCKGYSQHTLVDVLEKIAKEELEHIEELNDWANANFISFDTNIVSLAQNYSLQGDISLDNINTKELLQKCIEAEKESIELYRKYSKEVEALELSQRFNEIALDETKHLSQLIDIESQFKK